MSARLSHSDGDGQAIHTKVQNKVPTNDPYKNYSAKRRKAHVKDRRGILFA